MSQVPGSKELEMDIRRRNVDLFNHFPISEARNSSKE